MKFAFIECVAHYVHEVYMKKICGRKLTTGFVCIIGFITGIPFIYNGGYYLFDLVDSVATLVASFVVLFLESIIACII